MHASIRPEKTPLHWSSWAIPLALLLLGAALLHHELLQGWFPHDEGALGQSAERLLRGEIPHRDFDEIYTLLLSIWHALAFLVFGTSSVAMRLFFFAVTLVWLVALYRILIRFVSPIGSAIVSLTALTWSVPNYPAPMPSWYVMFAATFGALALIRWIEVGRCRWLVLAGMAGGIAFLFKLSGLLFLIGGGAALLAVSLDFDEAHERWKDGYSVPTLLVIGLLLVIVAGFAILVGHNGLRELIRFALPMVVLICGLCIRLKTSTWMWPRSPLRCFTPLVIFVSGGMLPILLLVAFYSYTGGLDEMWDGIFVAPFRRVFFAAFRPPPVHTLIACLPLTILLGLRSVGQRRLLFDSALLAVGLCTVAFLSKGNAPMYQLGFYSAWGLVFLISFEYIRLLCLHTKSQFFSPQHMSAILLAFIAVAMSLLEYPFAIPIYTLYSLPLVMVALTALVRVSCRVAPVVQLLLIGFFLIFGILRIVPGTVDTLGRIYKPSTEHSLLTLYRCGLYVTERDSTRYGEMIPFVQQTAAGRPIWAGPDAPEIYFLSALPNQTRTLFDFFDTSVDANLPLTKKLAHLGIVLVVLNLDPDFSTAPTPQLIRELRQVYRQERQFDGFLVLW